MVKGDAHSAPVLHGNVHHPLRQWRFSLVAPTRRSDPSHPSEVTQQHMLSALAVNAHQASIAPRQRVRLEPVGGVCCGIQVPAAYLSPHLGSNWSLTPVREHESEVAQDDAIAPQRRRDTIPYQTRHAVTQGIRNAWCTSINKGS